jgi:AAA+ ATPase superfamily predicted ATPase
MSILFPAGIASDRAFCNRKAERRLLAENIKGLNHTVIVAPRRYGKSSLAHFVLQEQKISYAWIDLLTVSSLAEVMGKISKGVSELVFQQVSDIKKVQLQIQKFFQSLNPEITLGLMGQSITLYLNTEQPTAIEEVLISLDQYLHHLGKKAVIVFDEFQQLSEFHDNIKLEGMIRHAVERSQAITYIFSGSNRHLLSEMFSSSVRPLYRLCQMLNIERIQEAEYWAFLKKAALGKWNEYLSQSAFEKIIFFTECHSFYMNALCNKLWKQVSLPDEKAVIVAWEEYVMTHKSIIVSDLIGLSLNQKKLVSVLAQEATQEVFSKNFVMKTNLSVSSIRQALDVLLKKDIVYQSEEGLYQVLDPGIKYYLLKK